MNESIVTIEKPRKDNLSIPCSKCNTTTNHKVLTSVKDRWSVGEYDVQGETYFDVVSCLGCSTISFRRTSSNSEDWVEEEGRQVYVITEEIYPNRIIGRSALSEQYYLPDKVRGIYDETHKALSSKLKILAGVGIRGLVESVCLEEKAKGSTLEKKIDDLVKKGILTSASAIILHKTRLLGNKSAHELNVAKDQELGVAFDIVENMLQTLYVIPNKAQSLD